MPPQFPVIGFDPWKSEPERAVQCARRARILFVLRNIGEGLCWGIILLGAVSGVLWLFGILPQ